MIGTILTADLVWLAIMLPLQIGVQLLLALRTRRAAVRASKQADLSIPYWARGPRTAPQKFKLAQMRARRK